MVKLCIDICKRNGLKKVLWIADKDKSLAYTPASRECVLTVHRWFANKSCPGNWMYSRMGQLADEINAGLGTTTSTSTSREGYFILLRKEVDDIEDIDTDNIRGAIQAAWQELSQAFMDDSFLKGLVDAGTDILSFLTAIIDKIGTLPTLITAVAAVMSFKNVGRDKMFSLPIVYMPTVMDFC